ncbi:MAG: DUF6470 family protein [Bacillota bacterium]
MQLIINQQRGKIGINTTPSQMEVRQKAANYQLDQLPGRLNISNQAGKVEVSYRAVRSDLNSKNYREYSRELVEKGRQLALEGITRYAQQGDQLARIEQDSTPLISQAVENAQDENKKIGLRWKRGAEVSYQSGKQEIDFVQQDIDGIELTISENKPQIRAQQGKVDVYLKDQSRLEINFVDQRV